MWTNKERKVNYFFPIQNVNDVNEWGHKIYIYIPTDKSDFIEIAHMTLSIWQKK